MIAGLPCSAFSEGRAPEAVGCLRGILFRRLMTIEDNVGIESIMIEHSNRFLLPWVLAVLFGVCALTPLIGRAQGITLTTPASPGLVPSGFLPIVLGVGTRNSIPTPTPGPPGDESWLMRLNEHRQMAGLPPVQESVDWSRGAWSHSRYMVKNDLVDHEEDPDNSWYTPEGDQAARSSNLAASSVCEIEDAEVIDLWMRAPFHGISLIDPELRTVGYGSFREEDGGLQMGAALDVLRGQGGIPGEVNFPLIWPRDGSVVTLTSNAGEYPDPLASCPGYTNPSGLPILVQIGDGSQIPGVTAHALHQGGTLLEHCIFDETSYDNSNADSRKLGRLLLDMRDAIVMIPRHPLVPGPTYSVSITVNGQELSWSFRVADAYTQAEKFGVDIQIP